MNDETLKLAASVGLYPYYPEQAGDIECFYHAAFNAGLEAAANVCNQRFIECMEPESRELRDTIRALEKK